MESHGRPVPRAEQRRRTEARVLAQARRLFSELGYDRTTIRAVATAAHTDAGLVIRYFGSKEKLFAKATQVPEEEPVTGKAPGQVAEQLLASLTAKLESEPYPTLAMLRSMLTHPDAAAGARAEINRQQAQLSSVLDAPDAQLRTALFGAVVLGLVVGRYLLELDGLKDAQPEQVAELMRPCIQALTAVDPEQ